MACEYDTSGAGHRFTSLATRPSAMHDLLVEHRPQRVKDGQKFFVDQQVDFDADYTPPEGADDSDDGGWEWRVDGSLVKSGSGTGAGSYQRTWSQPGSHTVNAKKFNNTNNPEDDLTVQIVEGDIALQVKQDGKLVDAVPAGETVTLEAETQNIANGQSVTFTAEWRASPNDEWDDVMAGGQPWSESDEVQNNLASVTRFPLGAYYYRFKATYNAEEDTDEVTGVGVDRIIVDGSDPEDEGPAYVAITNEIKLRAMPVPEGEAFPSGHPQWTIETKPTGSTVANPAAGATATLKPDDFGEYEVKATCGDSSDTFAVTVVKVTDADGNRGYQRVGDTEEGEQTIWNVVGVRGDEEDVVVITIRILPDNSDTRGAISWDGATEDPDNPLTATMPIAQSTAKTVTVKVSEKAAQEIRIWPVWVTVGNFRGDNANGETLNPNNNPALSLPCGALGLPAPCGAGAANNCEIKGTIEPSGVSALDEVQFDFKRTIVRKAWWKNTGDLVWHLISVKEGTDDPDNADEDLHDKNDIIWVIDGPGFINAPQGDHLAYEMNAIEAAYVVLNQPSNEETVRPGVLCSNKLRWYTILNVKEGANGQAVRDANRRNEIRVGAITIGTQPQ